MTSKRPAAADKGDPFASPKVTTGRYLPKSPPPGQENPATPEESAEEPQPPQGTPAGETPEDKKPEDKEKKQPSKTKKPPGVMKGRTFTKPKAKSQQKGLSPKTKAKAKASPKTKAKQSTPKSKAKTKAKASAKTKAKSTPKKKDSKEEKEEEKTSPPKKRPAAAKSSLREQTQKWKKGALAEEKTKEEQDLQEEAEGEDETEEKKEGRDSGKARAFSRMVKKGAVPSMVKDMLAEIEKSDQPRAKKTALINALFKKTSDGSFEMKTNSTEFETFKESFKKNTETDQVSGEPKSVFLYRVYHGNSEALEAAIQQGHVMETVRKGVVYCYYPTWSIAQEKGTTDRGELKGSTKLNKEDFSAMAEAFNKIAKKKASPEALSSSSGARPQLALEDTKVEAKNTKPDWKQLQPLLEEAKAANDRLEKDLFKLKTRVEKAEDNKLLQNLKGLVVQCSDTQKQISHTLVWNEAPPDSDVEWTAEGVNKWFFQMATKTEALDEGLEQIKAVLKARNL